MARIRLATYALHRINFLPYLLTARQELLATLWPVLTTCAHHPCPASSFSPGSRTQLKTAVNKCVGEHLKMIPPAHSIHNILTRPLIFFADTVANMIIKIDVTSDLACPWCYVGWKRLQRAMKTYEGDEILFEVRLLAIIAHLDICDGYVSLLLCIYVTLLSILRFVLRLLFINASLFVYQ